MNNNKNDSQMNKETLFSGLAVFTIGLVMMGLSLLNGSGGKFSNFKWRTPNDVKRDDEVIH